MPADGVSTYRPTAHVERTAAWLKAFGIKMVVMQSTGFIGLRCTICWKRGDLSFAGPMHAVLTNNLPGRKSDVQESQWLLKLHTYGLLRNFLSPTR
jgi:transposase